MNNLLLLAAVVLTTVVPQEKRLTNRMVFLVDVSGSMSGNDYKEAVTLIDGIVSQQTDDFKIKVIAFNGGYQEWQKKWEPFPSANGRKKLLKWLKGLKITGVTDPTPALKKALTYKEKNKSLVLVSDGFFHHAAFEKVWKKKKLTLATLGVGIRAKTNTTMKHLGKIGKGGYFIRKKFF